MTRCLRSTQMQQPVTDNPFCVNSCDGVVFEIDTEHDCKRTA